MKKLILLSFLCFITTAFAFADGLTDKTKDVPRAETTITAPEAIPIPIVIGNPTIFSFPVPIMIPQKPWVIAAPATSGPGFTFACVIQCGAGTGPVNAYLFSSYEEAYGFGTSWCTYLGNTAGGCNFSIYWSHCLPPLYIQSTWMLITSVNCWQFLNEYDR